MIISWNCRGAGGREFLRTARDLIFTHKPDCLIIVEPRISGRKADNRIKKLQFDFSTKMDAEGFSGGIWVLWNASFGSVTVVNKSKQIITLLVEDHQKNAWLLSAVYASPNATSRELLWQYIEKCDGLDEVPWVIIGDFNQVLSTEESSTSTARGFNRMTRMNEVIQTRQLIDLGNSGPKYTWTNKRKDGALIRKRLDRAFCNMRWRILFSEAMVRTLPRTHGDHSPLLLNIQGLAPPRRDKRPFRFEAAWLLHPDFQNFLVTNWAQDTELNEAITEFIEAIKKWNKEIFGNIFERKKRILARLVGIQRSLETTASSSLSNLEKRLIQDYNDILIQEEIFWFQKARSKWLHYGDKNTKYFHASTIVKRRKNRIVALKDNQGRWVFDPVILKAMAVEFFTNLYKSEPLTLDPAASMCFPRRTGLLEREKEELGSPVTASEVYAAIKQMNPYKAPGPDGLQAVFFQANWGIVGKSVTDFILAAFSEGNFDIKMNETLLCLIPKTDHPEVMSQFRPISLCNVVVKTITRIIVNRIRPLLRDLIPPTQSSFIPGRGCNDNILVVQEAIHSLKRKKGRNGSFLMKIDLEKAYDRISWEFLKWVLVDFGLPSNLVSLIMWCVTTSEISLLWNGEKLDSFKPQRGLRQGDPLSPYLFVLCLDKLAQLIEYAVANKSWKPVRLSQRGPALSHMFFADDLILFGMATSHNINVIMNCINMFCSFSGEKVNPSKSKILFSPNTPRDTMSHICELTGMEATEDLGKYLGVPLHTKRVTKAMFRDLITRVNTKLSLWKAKHLSIAGRRVLIQSVSSTMASHVMQCTKLPVGVCETIDKANRNFLWGGSQDTRKIPLVKWETVCLPKDYGGLGIRCTADANKALLSKLGWRLMTKEKTLWTEIMEAKYMKNDTFLTSTSKHSNSPTWKAILSSREIIEEGMGKIVQNGQSTMFWLDNWVNGEPLALVATADIPPEELGKTVAEYWDEGSWSWPLLLPLLPLPVVQEISRHVINPSQEDITIWSRDPDHGFSTASAYKIIIDATGKEKQGSWKLIWDLKIPPKIQVFLWLLCHNRVLTNASRLSRGLTTNDACPRCNQAREDVLHLLRDCPQSKIFWKRWKPENRRRSWGTATREEWIQNNLQQCRWRVDHNLPWNVVFAITCWEIWLDRNKMVFNPEERDIEGRLQNLELQLQDIVSFQQRGEIFQPTQEVVIRWEPPRTGFVKINTDGAAHYTTGKATAGGLCRGENGQWLFGFSARLGNVSAQQAEVQAIWQGLEMAWTRGFRKVILESDSKLVVTQLTSQQLGTYGRNLWEEKCRELINRNWDCQLSWVYREANTCADRLATMGMHLDKNIVVYDMIPDQLRTCYESDLAGSRHLRLV